MDEGGNTTEIRLSVGEGDMVMIGGDKIQGFIETEVGRLYLVGELPLAEGVKPRISAMTAAGLGALACKVIGLC